MSAFSRLVQFSAYSDQIQRQTQTLEIWGKAQRESARRPKSDWGKLEGGG